MLGYTAAELQSDRLFNEKTGRIKNAFDIFR